MLEQQVSEVPGSSSPSVCNDGEHLEAIDPERTLARFRAFTLFVSPSSSLTEQPLTGSPELRRLTQRITFSSARIRVVPDEQVVGCRFTSIEKEVYARLPGWRR